ncbi:hypothetical protein [Nostoc sp. C117]|uniref:hypothetical protein n=1 Tax=Nostoc sp. C117 TaxID=3349875 RepID=UPI00370DCB18
MKRVREEMAIAYNYLQLHLRSRRLGDRKILLELHRIDRGDRLSYNGNLLSGDR